MINVIREKELFMLQKKKLTCKLICKSAFLKEESADANDMLCG